MKIAPWALATLLVAPLGVIAAQQDNSSPSAQAPTEQQQDSLAEAARRAQADKAQKKDESKTPKVWDNDSIPDVPGNISVVGQSGGETPSTGEGEQKPPTPAAPATPEQKAAAQSDLDSAKAQLESLKTDLDIAQRKNTLDEQTYLSNPNHEQDKAGASTLQDEKDDIASKQQQIMDLEKKIEDLQGQLAAAGNDSSK